MCKTIVLVATLHYTTTKPLPYFSNANINRGTRKILPTFRRSGCEICKSSEFTSARKNKNMENSMTKARKSSENPSHCEIAAKCGMHKFAHKQGYVHRQICAILRLHILCILYIERACVHIYMYVCVWVYTHLSVALGASV